MRNLKSKMLVCLLAASAAFAVGAVELDEQKSTERGVTVTVTPKYISGNASTWDFKIVLDTHSQDLNDDLTKSAVLLDGTGAIYAPIGWDGAGPGGHHREGTLRFKPVSPQPQTVELQITRSGESVPRSFHWRLQ